MNYNNSKLHYVALLFVQEEKSDVTLGTKTGDLKFGQMSVGIFPVSEALDLLLHKCMHCTAAK